MNIHYIEPSFRKTGFTCPHCVAYSAMKWFNLHSTTNIFPVWLAMCHKCTKYSLWVAHYTDEDETEQDGDLVYPDVQTAPLPNDDIPESCRDDYLEARLIERKSPRGAAALLRLCIQKLCRELGGNGKNIYDDIGVLVAKGLSPQIQQALDVVRIVGNSAVHPGELSVEDNPEIVSKLFTLVNLIVDSQITQPKLVRGLFQTMPEKAKEQVERRDATWRKTK